MKVIQGLINTFTDFLQRLGSAVNTAILDPETRQSLIEILTFENTNTECRSNQTIESMRSPYRQMDRRDNWHWFSGALC